MDPHDEVTAVDLPGAVKVASGLIKPRVLCCGGTGVRYPWAGTEDANLVTFCWCPAGLRLVCAVPHEEWPLERERALAVAQRIGLQGVA